MDDWNLDDNHFVSDGIYNIVILCLQGTTNNVGFTISVIEYDTSRIW